MKPRVLQNNESVCSYFAFRRLRRCSIRSLVLFLLTQRSRVLRQSELYDDVIKLVSMKGQLGHARIGLRWSFA
jgi:hypothetical protein